MWVSRVSELHCAFSLYLLKYLQCQSRCHAVSRTQIASSSLRVLKLLTGPCFPHFVLGVCLLLGYRRTVIVSHVNLVPVALLTLLMTRRRASTRSFYLLAVGSLRFSMERSGYPR